jgi:hypothetical protein
MPLLTDRISEDTLRWTQCSFLMAVVLTIAVGLQKTPAVFSGSEVLLRPYLSDLKQRGDLTWKFSVV